MYYTELHDDKTSSCISNNGSNTFHTVEPDFELGYNIEHDIKFFGTLHTLTTDISTFPTQYLRNAHVKLKTTRHAKLQLITMQHLLTSPTLSMFSYNQLCTLIPHQHCIKFDKYTHGLHLTATTHTRTQLANVIFLNHKHHILYIPSMLD